MTTPDAPDPLARRARAAFDAASESVPAATANRLRLARRAALSGPPPRRRRVAPIAGAIAVGLAAWWAWPRVEAPTDAPVAATRIVPTPAMPEVRDATPPPDVAPNVAVPDAAIAEDAVPPEDVLADDDPALDAIDDDDAELYAWLADAPVAPDTPGGAP